MVIMSIQTLLEYAQCSPIRFGGFRSFRGGKAAQYEDGPLSWNSVGQLSYIMSSRKIWSIPHKQSFAGSLLYTGGRCCKSLIHIPQRLESTTEMWLTTYTSVGITEGNNTITPPCFHSVSVQHLWSGDTTENDAADVNRLWRKQMNAV